MTYFNILWPTLLQNKSSTTRIPIQRQTAPVCICSIHAHNTLNSSLPLICCLEQPSTSADPHCFLSLLPFTVPPTNNSGLLLFQLNTREQYIGAHYSSGTKHILYCQWGFAWTQPHACVSIRYTLSLPTKAAWVVETHLSHII